MVEDYRSSVGNRYMREKKDREAAREKEEDICEWIRLPNRALNGYRHHLIILELRHRHYARICVLFES